MPYEGQSLAEAIAAMKGPTRAAAHAMADEGGRVMTRRVKENTPISTTHLRDSVKQKPIIEFYDELGRRVYSTGAETDSLYADFIEHGSGLWGPKHAKFEIRPKNPGGVLAFKGRVTTMGARWDPAAGRYRPAMARLDKRGNPMTGATVFAKRVMHPGAPGQHMFSIGAAATESEFERSIQDILQRWRIEAEAAIKATPRRRFA